MWGGVPRIIKRFIKKIKNLDSKYLFSVCTCADTTGTTNKILSRLINKCGGKLSSAFAVRMPGNFIVRGEAMPVEKRQKLFADWDMQLKVICECIETKKENQYEEIADSDDKIGNFLFSLTFINSLLSKMNLSRDKYFYINDKCTSCGTCAKICPVENITFTNGKPRWRHHCEMCLACLQWCPNEAIQYKIHPPYRKPGDSSNNQTENRKRYHHPSIKIQDLTKK